MRTVRRLYFYGLALLSLEVVIWGTIHLLRTVVSRGIIGSGSLLATGLSLVLVGAPIFWFHWRTVQHDALGDPEEHASRIRAVFLYAALFSTLLPIAYAALALLDRLLSALFGQPSASAWFGGGGSAWDNIIAILINAAALAYFWYVLRKDWQQLDTSEGFLPDARRFYWYLWVLIGLTVTVAGVYNLVNFVLSITRQDEQGMMASLAAGISLLLVGVPLWAYHWWVVQTALVDLRERRSLLRLVVLYLVSLAGVIGVIAAAARVLNSLIFWLLGNSNTFARFLQGNAQSLGIAIPLALMWWYYGRLLNREVAAVPDQPRREALRRLYNYILALMGLAVTFAGLINLVDFLARVVVGRELMIGNVRNESVFYGMLSGSLAALLIGLPVWLVPWRKMQGEAARLDDTGDHARLSVLRKTYLYLVLFLLVAGAMGFAGVLLYTLISALFTGGSTSFAHDVFKPFLSLVIDSALLIYHWQVLRQDTRLAQQTLGDLHAAFPTLVLLEKDDVFGKSLIADLQRVAPRLPVAVHMIERGAPDETMLGAKAILLPVGLALKPPESLQLWLDEYKGLRILIPLADENWYWLGQAEKQDDTLAKETAQALRQIAEGEAVRQALPGSPWSIAGYIMGGLFGLLLLLFFFSLIVSSLFQ